MKRFAARRGDSALDVWCLPVTDALFDRLDGKTTPETQVYDLSFALYDTTTNVFRAARDKRPRCRFGTPRRKAMLG